MKIFKLCGLVVAGLLAATSVHAVDTVTSRDAPDLTKVRAAIKAKDYSAAIVDLKGMVNQGIFHADVYSLLGFSYRKTADFKSARVYYAKALEFDADHKGALEYQGEMFVELGQIADARKNLERLVKLCPTGCEEREDLEQALKKAGTAS
jgi:Flp pilus assembly protein TadD